MTAMPPGAMLGAQPPMPAPPIHGGPPHPGAGAAQGAVQETLVRVIIEAFDQLALADHGQLPTAQAHAFSVLAENPLYQQLMQSLAAQHAAGPPPGATMGGPPAGMMMGHAPAPILAH